MTKNKFLVLILSFLSVSSIAQKTDSITGKWKFLDFYKVENNDPNNREMAKKIFGEMTFYFKPNKHYKAFLLNNNEEGTWVFDQEKRKLILTANKGTVNEMDVISLTADRLTISLGRPSFILERTTPGEKDEIEETVPKMETVSVSTAQVAKKWFLKRREVPNRTEEQIKMMSELAKGTYLDFKRDGSYQAQLLAIKVDGSWTFGAENRSIIVSVENQKQIWNIKSISENELVLVKGNSAEIWKFSTKEE